MLIKIISHMIIQIRKHPTEGILANKCSKGLSLLCGVLKNNKNCSRCQNEVF